MSIFVELQLVDKVTKNADQIKSALDEIQHSAKSADDALGQKFGKKLQTSYINNYLKSIRNEMKDIQKEADKQDKKKENIKESLTAGSIIAANIFTDAIIGGIKLFYNGIKDAMELVGQGEQTEIGLKYTAPQAREYIKQDVNAYSGITGQGQETTKQQLLPIIRSLGNHADADTIARQVREAASDISVMSGRGTKDIQGILDTFEKINQREGLQGRQLQHLGVNEKEFYTLLGKNLGITESAAKKAAEKGKNSDAVRNTLLTLVANKEGGRTGNATNDYAESFQGRVEKLKSLPEDFLAGLSGTPVLKEINDQLAQTYKWIIDNKEQIAGGLLTALTGVDNILKVVLNPESIKTWVGYFSSAVSIMGFFAKHIDGITTAVELMGVAFLSVKGIGFINGLITSLPVLGTLLGESVVAFTAFGTSLAATMAAIAAPLALATLAIGGFIYAYKEYKDLIAGEGRKDISHFSAGNSDAMSDPSKVNEFSPEWKRNKLNAARSANGELPVGYQPSYATSPSLNNVAKSGAPSMTFAPTIQIDASSANFSSEEDRDKTLQMLATQTNDQLQQLFNQGIRQSGN